MTRRKPPCVGGVLAPRAEHGIAHAGFRFKDFCEISGATVRVGSSSVRDISSCFQELLSGIAARALWPDVTCRNRALFSHLCDVLDPSARTARPESTWDRRLDSSWLRPGIGTMSVVISLEVMGLAMVLCRTSRVSTPLDEFFQIALAVHDFSTNFYEWQSVPFVAAPDRERAYRSSDEVCGDGWFNKWRLERIAWWYISFAHL